MKTPTKPSATPVDIATYEDAWNEAEKIPSSEDDKPVLMAKAGGGASSGGGGGGGKSVSRVSGSSTNRIFNPSSPGKKDTYMQTNMRNVLHPEGYPIVHPTGGLMPTTDQSDDAFLEEEDKRFDKNGLRERVQRHVGQPAGLNYEARKKARGKSD